LGELVGRFIPAAGAGYQIQMGAFRAGKNFSGLLVLTIAFGSPDFKANGCASVIVDRNDIAWLQ